MADIDTSAAAEKLADWFGERCDEYDPECSTCRAWEAFDAVSRDLEAMRAERDAAIATLQARVRELESAFSHLYGQAVWLRGDQAYRGFARAFINRMSALRIKCVSRQELAKIEEKQND